MKDEIRKILLETLTSAYDDGNIENGGIFGGEEAIERLNTLYTDKMFEAARNGLTCAQILSRGECATRPETTCIPTISESKE